MLSKIALFIDTRSRDLMVSTVAVTSTVFELVLRFGSQVGKLQDLTRSGEMKDFGLPIIVGTKGYQAQSSEGFVEVMVGSDAVYQTDQIVGVQGFPWMHGKGLAVLATPQPVVVLRPGTNLIPVETSAETTNPEGYRRHHSNHASKEAALEGLRLRALTHPREVVLAEGQSDYCHGWRLVGYHELYREPWKAEWTREHRVDRFTPENLISAAVRGAANRTIRGWQDAGSSGDVSEETKEGLMFISLNLLALCSREVTTKVVPEWEWVFGVSQIGEIAKNLAESMRIDGWQLGIDVTVANHFLQAMKAGEVVTSGWGACHLPVGMERQLVWLADGLSEETRTELLARLDTQDPKDRAWESHIGA